MSQLAQDFERYADLIRRQIDALAADDLDQVARLAAERTILAGRIGTPTAHDEDVRAAIERCAELDARFVSALTELRDAAFHDLRVSDERRSAIRAYGSSPTGSPALDFRF